MSVDYDDPLWRLMVEPGFLKSLKCALEAARSRNRGENQPDYADDEPWCRLQWDNRAILDDHCLRSAFEKYVIAKAGDPPPITIEDLEENAFQQLGGATTQEIFPEGEATSSRSLFLDRFLHYVWFRLPAEDDLTETSAEVDLGGWGYCDEAGEPLDARELPYTEDAADECILWVSESGFSLQCKLKLSSPWPLWPNASATVYAAATPAARALAEVRFRAVLPSLATSLCRVSGKAFPEYCHHYFGMPELPRIPQYTLLTEQFGKRFLADCLDAYFKESTKKDTRESMRKAINLLIAADSQSNESIAVSLCVAAVEALVCKKTEALADDFSRKVAALLHHDSRERADVAKSVKNLYQVRSDTLHGNSLAEKSDKLAEARLLAAGVLGAIVEWRDFQKRSGENTNREVFLDQLDKAERAGGRMVGIPEGFKNCLPGAPKASPAP